MEPTNYRETVEILDAIVKDRGVDDFLFDFGTRMASKILERAVRITKATCSPGGQGVRLKDLRSSMACDLLNKDWTTDEVNRRLGHSPGSPHIRKYANWVAVDTRKPKQRLRQHEIDKVRLEMDAMRNREKLTSQRQQVLEEEIGALRAKLEANNRLMYEQIVRLVERNFRRTGDKSITTT
jgi:hypothetical protein